MMEWNPGEAVKNNVLGTRTLADLAASHETSEFVMISTDKAVNPTSVMGATKRVAELYIQALSERSKTKFVAVRFGNVLGGRGSVLGAFHTQIEAGGPVTVTDPEVTRFFMLVEEAVQLVIQAGSLEVPGGVALLLDMGEPVSIKKMAEELIREHHRPIKIVYTGLRPGEKLHEVLLSDQETASATDHEMITMVTVADTDGSDTVERLREAGCGPQLLSELAGHRPLGRSPSII